MIIETQKFMVENLQVTDDPRPDEQIFSPICYIAQDSGENLSLKIFVKPT